MKKIHSELSYAQESILKNTDLDPYSWDTVPTLKMHEDRIPVDEQTDSASFLEGHAYHYNLPSHYIDKNDGIPLVTKYAERKAKDALEIAYSIQLSEELFLEEKKCGEDEIMDGHDDGMDKENEKITWVSSHCIDQK